MLRFRKNIDASVVSRWENLVAWMNKAVTSAQQDYLKTDVDAPVLDGFDLTDAGKKLAAVNAYEYGLKLAQNNLTLAQQGKKTKAVLKGTSDTAALLSFLYYLVEDRRQEDLKAQKREAELVMASREEFDKAYIYQLEVEEQHRIFTDCLDWVDALV